MLLMDEWINNFSSVTERNKRVSHDNDRVGIYLDYKDLMPQGSKSTLMVMVKILVVPEPVGERAGDAQRTLKEVLIQCCSNACISPHTKEDKKSCSPNENALVEFLSV